MTKRPKNGFVIILWLKPRSYNARNAAYITNRYWVMVVGYRKAGHPMVEVVLFAMIGAKLDMGVAFWVLYGIWAFCKFLLLFMEG